MDPVDLQDANALSGFHNSNVEYDALSLNVTLPSVCAMHIVSVHDCI